MIGDGTQPAAGGQHLPAGGGLDPNAVGEFLLRLISSKSFGLAATLLLIIMVVYRLVKGRSVKLAHCLKLVEGALALYLGITIWAVFALTDPPAIHAIGHEMLPYVGLVTLVVMCSFALPALKHAFSHEEATPPKTPEGPPPAKPESPPKPE